MYQNAGEKGDPHRDPDDPPRRRANKFNGHGTYDNDRPPILGVIGRSTGEVYLQETHRSTRKALQPVVESVTQKDTTVMTDEWHAYDLLSATGRGHSTVNHLAKEWARDDDGDGVREVHTNTIEGHWTGLRNFLRMFRGVHKRDLAPVRRLLPGHAQLQGRRAPAPRDPPRPHHLDGPMSRFPYYPSTVWMGAETSAPVTVRDVDVMGREPVTGCTELAGDAALDLAPGTTVTLDGTAVRIGAVTHRLDGVALRTSVLVEREDVAGGRLMATFEAVVRRITRRLDYAGVYSATVVQQRASGRLDLRPEDPRRPSCADVPYRTLPGLAVEIPAGSLVSFTYENADPRRPVVVLWEPSTAAGRWTLYGGTHGAEGTDLLLLP